MPNVQENNLQPHTHTHHSKSIRIVIIFVSWIPILLYFEELFYLTTQIGWIYMNELQF